MYSCKKCNSKLIFDAKYCAECGYVIDKEVSKKVKAKLCIDCQEKIPNEAKYCDICGYEQREEVVEKEETKKCPYCAELIKKDAVKCRYCGEFLNSKGKSDIKEVKQVDSDKKEIKDKKVEPIIKPIEKTIIIPEGFVYVEGGTFQMGDTFGDGFDNEKPVHSVTVDSFYIGKYEVTQKEYQAVMGNNPSYFKGDNLPVEKVSFNDAVEFCNKYNKLKGLPNAYDSKGNIINWSSYRLPTEAEWEYAAKGGNKSKGYKYSGSNNPDEVAWYDENSGEVSYQEITKYKEVKKMIEVRNWLGIKKIKESTEKVPYIEKEKVYKANNKSPKPVGSKKPNELGIYDMSGNVWEWCSDWYDGRYYDNSTTINPYNNKLASGRVDRGGSWFGDAGGLRVSGRGNVSPSDSGDVLGFRLIRTAP